MTENGGSIPGLELHHTLAEHHDTIIGLAWSPDGKRLASGAHNRVINIWNMANKRSFSLRGHNGPVNCLAWSPDQRLLASGSADHTICIWNTNTWQLQHRLTGHESVVYSIAWSPRHKMLASGSWDNTIRLWNVATGQLLRTLTEHAGIIYCVAWSPNGRFLASASDDGTIRVWDTRTWQVAYTFADHMGSVRSIAWSPDGRSLASGSSDKTIRIWDVPPGQQMQVIEGHTGAVFAVSFSARGRFLVSKSKDGTVQLWRTDTYENVAIIPDGSHQDDVPEWLVMTPTSGPAFHPKAPVLATLGERDARAIRIWQLDVNLLHTVNPSFETVHYTNAKVVLIGDSGVGKSGLSLVLTGQSFAATDSTHGRRIALFHQEKVALDNQRREARETLLWDLAGQPAYRLIHQLHLNEVTVALIIFDAHSETDLFAGVQYWNRALDQAQRAQGRAALPLKKFLVAARIDRGGIPVSRERIERLQRELGFDGYFETSAKERWGIPELIAAIRGAIAWERLPRVSSTELFLQIKDFLIAEKTAGRVLATTTDLYHAFLRSNSTLTETESMWAQFETCIGRVEARGLLRRLSFGDLVLLQPELLDAYASVIVNAAHEEPDGLGCITEEDVHQGRLRIPEDERISSRDQEQLLLIATVEDLLRHEIALRERANGGPYLIFPSQLTRTYPDLPDPDGKAITFSFDGPTLNIYATLAVRLTHSETFQKQELWRNAATYTTSMGGTYGVLLHEVAEGRGELTLFFDGVASEHTRLHFEDYVYTHLRRRTLPESIQRRRIFICHNCSVPITNRMVIERRKRGHDWIMCNVCDTRIFLHDRKKLPSSADQSFITRMDKAADAKREQEIADSVLRGKQATSDFDVFISFSPEDRPWVHEWLMPRLQQHGVYALTEAQFDIGPPYLKNIEDAVQHCPKTLLILTPAWVQNKWREFEALSLQTNDPANIQKRVLPLQLEPCELPQRLAIFTSADFTNPISWEKELKRVVKAVEDRDS
jgi:WD40 repeat protein